MSLHDILEDLEDLNPTKHPTIEDEEEFDPKIPHFAKLWSYQGDNATKLKAHIRDDYFEMYKDCEDLWDEYLGLLDDLDTCVKLEDVILAWKQRGCLASEVLSKCLILLGVAEPRCEILEGYER